MFDGGTSSVLPTHSGAIEKALEQSGMWVVRNSELVDMWNPDTLPERFLPWLAWSVSVDEWDDAWTVERKRSVIRASVSIHRRKGTVQAVKDALELIDFEAQITEWFEDGSTPHTFKVDVFGAEVFDEGQVADVELIEAIRRHINPVKPVRSHYGIRVGENFESYYGVETAMINKHVMREDHLIELRQTGGENVVSVDNAMRASRYHYSDMEITQREQ